VNARAWFYGSPGFHSSAVPDVTLPALAGDEPAPTFSDHPEAAGTFVAAAAHPLCVVCGEAYDHGCNTAVCSDECDRKAWESPDRYLYFPDERPCDECGSAGRCHPNCSFVRGDE
jgi:hypothetical protein